MSQQAAIGWAPLEFVDPGAPAPAEGYLVEAMADGTNFGNPQPRIEIVQSLLTDGALAVLEGWDNREAPIRLRISARKGVTAGPALAAAEKALMTGVLAPSKAPLVYVPAATAAATCVFDVVAAHLDRDTSDGWDLEEQQRAYRYYLLTLTCLPFVRAEQTTVVPALPVPPNPGGAAVFQNLDTCDATTNWSRTYDYGARSPSDYSTSIAVVAGAVRSSAVVVGAFANAYYPGITQTRTGALSMSGLPYLAVDVRVSHPAIYGLPVIKLDGVVVAPTAAEPIAGGLTRVYLATPNFSLLSASVPYKNAAADNATRWLEIANVARTDTIGDKANSTLRQQSRTATVDGAAPTQAAIRLFDATPAALGTDILVHSSTNTTWRPPLRRWVTTSTTADTTLVSGGRNTLSSPMVFRIPANLLTSGTYALLSRMSVSTAGTVGWSAKMVSAAGASTVGSSIVVSGATAVPVTTGYQVLHLAAIPLPVVAAEADQMVELTLTGTANMTVDEGWLFGLHDGALTWLRDADSLTWIEIRSPELGAARPSVFGGTGAKGANSVCVDWKCLSFGAHRFAPGVMQIFTVTTSSLVSQSELEFYERGHTHILDAS